LDISDRINVSYNAEPHIRAAISAQESHIRNEVLATAINLDESIELSDNELGIALTLKKVYRTTRTIVDAKLSASKSTMNERSSDTPPILSGGTKRPTNFIGGSVIA
jgi:hypothetical protein